MIVIHVIAESMGSAMAAAFFWSPRPLARRYADPIPAGICVNRCSSSSAASSISSAGFAVKVAKFSLFSTSAIPQQAQSKTQTSAARTLHTCECHDLFDEMVPYVTSWTWQKETVGSMCAAVTKGEEPSSSVMILQHPPVYTMGTRSSDSYLRFDKENPPFELHRTERGGEVTYHGPGQLVMYPILNLRQHKMDLHWYLRTLEEVVIRTLWSACCLRASRVDGLTGVWVGEAKVAAIGIRVSRWITYHGLALNVTTDLAPFQNIVPCGISDRQVGSIQQLLKDKHHEDQVNGSLTTNKMLSSPHGLGNGSYKTGLTSDMSQVAGKTVWDDATLLSHVHSTLLAEFAEVFQLQLVPPIRDSQETLSVLSSSR